LLNIPIPTLNLHWIRNIHTLQCVIKDIFQPPFITKLISTLLNHRLRLFRLDILPCNPRFFNPFPKLLLIKTTKKREIANFITFEKLLVLFFDGS
jgi:hypothetical protein